MGKTALEFGAFLSSTAYTGHSLSGGSALWEVAVALVLAVVGCTPMVLHWVDMLSCCGDTLTSDKPAD
jgi:hypothetical protein